MNHKFVNHIIVTNFDIEIIFYELTYGPNLC
jgi:hypothetical protein